MSCLFCCWPSSSSIHSVETGLLVTSPKVGTNLKGESHSSVGNNASSTSQSSSPKLYDDRLLGLRLANDCLANIFSHLSCGDSASLLLVSRTLNRRIDLCGWKIRARDMGLSEEDIKTAGGAKLAIQQALQTEATALYKLKALTNPAVHKEFICIEFGRLSKKDETTLKNIGEKSAQSIREIKDFFSKSSYMQSATSLILADDSTNSRHLTQLPTSNLTFASVIDATFSKLPLQQPSRKSQPAIPPWVFRLPKLKLLALQNLGLTEIPDDIRFCSMLKTLSLGNSFEEDGRLKNPNRIISLPAALSLLPLTRLSLHGLDLPLIPQEACQLAHLTALDIDDNPRLETLPSSFTQLKNLNSLYMENIGLTDWPPALLELNRLIDLKIGRNKLIDISDKVAHWLTQLESLHVQKNPWSSKAITILEEMPRRGLHRFRRMFVLL